ncbi:hypothetical protein DNTS_014489 [Danionella cerebrum]|uniref:EF-hand domain-containing protein n=1 Tax=Danionella cerebrum TaxID=2873325 RepID=A0A553R3K7_9TELE|nr:hypothetical protein DNTS_014489 [Danionella translucida]
MLCLCLYVPVHNSDQIEVEYFESNGLPSELKSLKSLSVLLPSQEFSTYRKWRMKTLKTEEKEQDGQLDFEEFVHYLQDHEKDLKLVFKSLDRNTAGQVNANDIVNSLHDLGVHISRQQAERVLKSMDKNGTMTIDWNEWKKYPTFQAAENIPEIILYWKHSTIFDVGENLMVPDEFTVEEHMTGIWWRHLVSGGAAGAVSRTCTAPLDRLKVLMQVHGSQGNMCIMSGLAQMIKEGGMRSLWRGNGINIIKIAPETALKFMAYEQIKRLMGTSQETLGITERFVAGSLAGVIAQSTIYPMEVLKTRLALRKTGQYKGISDCAKQILKTEGMSAFYRGYVPNMLGIIPYAGIDLAIYEVLFCSSLLLTDVEELLAPALWCRGRGSGGVGFASLWNSFQHVWSACELPASATTVEGSPQLTMSGLFKQIVANEGPTGLYRGLTPNFLKVVPAVSISYVVYEHIKSALGVQSR